MKKKLTSLLAVLSLILLVSFSSNPHGQTNSKLLFIKAKVQPIYSGSFTTGSLQVTVEYNPTLSQITSVSVNHVFGAELYDVGSYSGSITLNGQGQLTASNFRVSFTRVYPTSGGPYTTDAFTGGLEMN